MDSAHWKRVQELFHAAADLPPQEQRAFLKNACGENDGLMGEVLALLAEDAQGSSLLDRDVARIAGQFFGEAAISPLSFKEFGPYRIKHMLGEGGMGVVYLAERSDLGTLVAIKFLRDAWLSPARRERFASEQRTLAQLNHSSIARLYDADTLADGTPWFVMEYVEGVPLTRILPREPVLDRTAPAIIPRRLRSRAVRASAGGDSPRLEAVEYPRKERWFGAPARFRHRQATREPRDAGGPNPHRTPAHDSGLRRARTIPRRTRRNPDRRLFARRHPL